ncbi:MAG TPA: hypothetical protein VK025_11595 [Steroidobacter sp.]|jgi:hypothetical protein|nr:hypothetical protein [Steroidobacteraceae bacterium]HLS82037.1 hypothetical protein [Steroidobacter sp.]
MARCAAQAAWTVWAALLVGTALAESESDVPDVDTVEPVVEGEQNAWMDRAHRGLHGFLWRSAMRVDHWFGAQMEEGAYRNYTRGSIIPILLWDEFNGLDQKFRFRVNMPLPHLGERFDAFIGTFTRDEFVTEREQGSGAIPRQRAGGGVEEDETLVGIHYQERETGGRFEADAGLRIRSPIDPFVKAGWRFDHEMAGGTLLRLRETAFWQNSEDFGFTSRIDLERTFDERWLARWTASATISERSEGVRGYTALTVYRELPGERAVAVQAFTSGEFDAAVPLGEYGLRAVFRQQILREWLVLELRPGVTWPKDDPTQNRTPSWGIGVGLEMFFGEGRFQARPATF